MDDVTFAPGLTYRDPKAAVAWLAEAFGFELSMAIEGPDGDAATGHYEMTVQGRGRITVGGEWNEWMRSPASCGGHSTVRVQVDLGGDGGEVDAHCARARAAGATILAEPSEEFYGDRAYRCTDLEGHHWSFSAHVRDVTRAEAEAAIGTPIHAPAWR